jgi:hypothetical protein
MPSDVITEKYFAYAKCYNGGTSCMPSVVIPEKYFAYAKCCNVGTSYMPSVNVHYGYSCDLSPSIGEGTE